MQNPSQIVADVTHTWSACRDFHRNQGQTTGIYLNRRFSLASRRLILDTAGCGAWFNIIWCCNCRSNFIYLKGKDVRCVDGWIVVKRTCYWCWERQRSIVVGNEVELWTREWFFPLLIRDLSTHLYWMKKIVLRILTNWRTNLNFIKSERNQNQRDSIPFNDTCRLTGWHQQILLLITW